ncbi:thioredoxin family protein [Chloroflexota bacterium]
MAINLDRDTYESEVMGSKGLVLVDFWGPKCTPCLALMPAVEALEEKYAGKLKVTKVNATENRMLCAKLRVLGLPTCILYKDGTEIRRLVGDGLTKNDIVEAIDATLE